MKLINLFKKWFRIDVEEIQQKEPKTIQTLNVFDDVWIIINNEIHKGWIWEKTKNSIIVIYNSSNEFRFRYNRPLSQTVLNCDNATLILNENDIQCFKSLENNSNS